MKTRSLLTTVFIAVALASSATAGNQPTQVPLKGTLSIANTGAVQDGAFVVDGTGSGDATQLGEFAVAFNESVSFITGMATGTYNFTAANGDILYSSFTGGSTPLTQTVLLLNQDGTITGGTGRFAGASGTFTIVGAVDLTTLNFIGAFNGTVSTPAKKKQ